MQRTSRSVGEVCLHFAVAASFGLAPGVAVAQELDLREDADLRSVITSAIDAVPDRMAGEGIAALSFAVVDKHGVVEAGAFGHLDDAGEIATETTTLFSLQSVSKSLTAVAVLRAVQAGLLELDEPITKYLPDFTVNSRYEKHPERKLTLRRLLSHRAGFAHEAPLGNNYEPDCPSFEAHVQSIMETWLVYPVGERFRYSNLGIDVAAYAVEVVAEMPFAEYVEREVFGPLGMGTASFDWTKTRAAESRAIGRIEGVERAPLEVPMLGAGGLYASALDMAAFVQMHLAGGQRGDDPFLAPELLEEMYRLSFASPHAQEGYGLGLDSTRQLGFLMRFHGGGGFGFQSFMGWFPDLGFGVVVLTNDTHNRYHRGFAAELLQRLAAAAGRQPTMRVGKTPEPIDVTPEDVAWLLGDYVDDHTTIRVTLQGDVPSISIGGGGPRPLTFVDGDTAYFPRGPLPWFIRFVPGEGRRPGHIVQLVTGRSCDYNEGGPTDVPGPDRRRWKAIEGEYDRLYLGGSPATLSVERRNGHLYLEQYRLEEHEPGLFFDCMGRALDLRSEPARWDNIPISKR